MRGPAVAEGSPARGLLASPGVYLSPEDARSDVILAGATTLFGGFALQLLTRLPFYPRPGVLASVLSIGWVFALTGLVPLLLARYRGHGAAAFGLDRSRETWRSGLILAAPVALIGAALGLAQTGLPLSAVLGRLGVPVTAMGAGTSAAVALLIALGQFVALSAGALLLVTFLTTRGRDAFRTTEVSLTELTRTFGMGAALLALGVGLLRALGPGALLPTVLQVLALMAVVLLVDRQVSPGMVAPRTAVLTPVVVVLVIHVFATGGLLRGDLLTGVYAGALGAGSATAIAVLIETRWRAWAVLPLVLALHWWPTCLSPLAFELGAC